MPDTSPAPILLSVVLAYGTAACAIAGDGYACVVLWACVSILKPNYGFSPWVDRVARTVLASAAVAALASLSLALAGRPWTAALVSVAHAIAWAVALFAWHERGR